MRKRPGGESGASSKSLAGDTSSVVEISPLRAAPVGLAEYVEHFRSRVLQDALTEALRSTWLRRAEAFEAAMHRPGDFPGLCSVDQIETNNKRLSQKAEACRNHARICIFQDVDLICDHLSESA